MNYCSTRDPAAATKTAAEVIKQGLAADGGLFVPTELPALTGGDIQLLRSMDYPTRAATLLGKFLTDYTAEELIGVLYVAVRTVSSASVQSVRV